MTWRPTPALVGSLAAILVTLLGAVLLHRADLVVVAAPFAGGTLAALLAPRPALARVTARTPALTLWEDEDGAVCWDVSVDPTADAVTLVSRADPSLRPHTADVIQCLDGRSAAVLRLRAERWSRAVVRPVALRTSAAHGLLTRLQDGPFPAIFVTVLPFRTGFRAGDAMPHAAGLVGSHRSRALGSGHDLYAVRQFVPGDRLRRIVWPVSLRTRSLHVMTTTTERDADVQLILDSGVDVDGSLDLTVRAAASVAEYYLHRGDRVALVDLGRALRSVPFGGGRRHLHRIVEVLLDTKVRPPDVASARAVQRVPANALAIVFTTLLADDVAGTVGRLRRAGTAVALIDPLPERPAGSPDAVAATARRIALLQRQVLRDRLADLGVPMVPWRGPGSLDAVLVQLARSTRAPRRLR